MMRMAKGAIAVLSRASSVNSSRSSLVTFVARLCGRSWAAPRAEETRQVEAGIGRSRASGTDELSVQPGPGALSRVKRVASAETTALVWQMANVR